MTLTWFEKLPNTDAYRVGGHFAPYAVLARPVRFTDAELAAEVHAQEQIHTMMCYDDVYLRHVEGEQPITTPQERRKEFRRTRVLERFATQPHFDEGN